VNDVTCHPHRPKNKDTFTDYKEDVPNGVILFEKS